MKLFLSFLLLFFSISAFSDDGIADFKLGCSDPGAFHNQLPPTDLKIKCYDERFEPQTKQQSITSEPFVLLDLPISQTSKRPKYVSLVIGQAQTINVADLKK
jgi:hypothetical protein